MSELSQKITELPLNSAPTEGTFIPLSDPFNNLTGKSTLTVMRQSINFENAYTSVANALLKTKENDVFYVFGDQTLSYVLGYVNRGNDSYTALLDSTGEQVIRATGEAMSNSVLDAMTVATFDDLRKRKPVYDGQLITVKEYKKGTKSGGGKFMGFLSEKDDDGGFVASGGSHYWLRVDSEYAIPEHFGAIGDGITDDTVALSLATNSPYFNHLYFTKGKIYGVSGSIQAKEVKHIDGCGATIKLLSTPSSNTNVLQMGVQKGALSNLNVDAPQRSNTFTIPGISAIAEVGDLISLGSDSFRLQFDNNYYYGQRAIIVALSGDTVTINTGIYEAFTINSVTIHRGREPLVLTNLNMDLNNVVSTTANIQALSITGVNVQISNCKVTGSSYCAVGLGLQGCIGRVANCLFGGFLNANGTSARVGYGIYLDGCDFTISGNTFFNNKHCVTSASRRYLACGIVIENNHADTMSASSAEAVFDFHYNVVGVPVVQNNHIYAGKAVFNARNGGAKFINNFIYNNRTDTNSSPGVIALYECPTVYYLEFSDNYIETSSNVRLVYFGDINSVSNIIVTNNTGKLGSIFNQAMNIVSMKNVILQNNNFSGMTQIFEMNRRSMASTQPMFSSLEDVKVFNNTFDLLDNGVLGTAAIHIWSHANNPVANKLVVNNLTLKNNNINSKDTPILFEFISGAGVVEIAENTFSHAVTSSIVTAPTNNSFELQQSNFNKININNNTMPGRIRFSVLDTQKTGGTSYPTENISWKVSILGNSAAGLFFDCMAVTNDRRATFAHSQIKDNLFVNPYGTTIGFSDSSTTMGWNGGGVVEISNNTLYPASGASVGIGLGYRTHKIAINYNIISAAINDTATPFSANGNITVSLS